MVYLFLAEGFEEIEALTTADILKRAGIEVVMWSIDNNSTVSSVHNIKVLADCCEDKFIPNDSIEAIILPGGMPGAANLSKSDIVKDAIKFCIENNKYLCAICAAPFILSENNALNGKQATCYPGFERYLKGSIISDKPVCIDGNTITAKGPGCSFEFAFAIVSQLRSKEVADKLKREMQCII